MEAWGTVSVVVTVLVTPLGTCWVGGPTSSPTPTTVRSKAVRGRPMAIVGTRQASSPSKSQTATRIPRVLPVSPFHMAVRLQVGCIIPPSRYPS